MTRSVLRALLLVAEASAWISLSLLADALAACSRTRAAWFALGVALGWLA